MIRDDIKNAEKNEFEEFAKATKENAKKASDLDDEWEKIKTTDKKITPEQYADLHDKIISQISAIKLLINEMKIKDFELEQDAYDLVYEYEDGHDMPEYKKLAEDFRHIEDNINRLGTWLIELNENSYWLAEKVNGEYENRCPILDDEAVDKIFRDGQRLLSEEMPQDAAECAQYGKEAYRIAEKLRTDVTPYYFDKMIDYAQSVQMLERDSRAFYTPEEIDEMKTPLMNKFNEVSVKILQAENLAEDLLTRTPDDLKRYRLSIKGTAEGNVEIVKKRLHNIENPEISEEGKKLSIWIAGKERTDTITIGSSDGRIKQRTSNFEFRGLGFDSRETYKHGTVNKSTSVGNLFASYVKNTNGTRKISAEVSAAKIRRETQRDAGPVKIRNAAEISAGKIAVGAGYDSKKKKRYGQAQIAAFEAKDTLSVEMLSRIYQILTAQAALMSADVSLQLKGPIPYATLGGGVLDTNITVGGKEIKLISLNAVADMTKYAVSIENTAIQIGNKILAKIKDGTDIALNGADIIKHNHTDGLSMSASLGNEISWAAVTVKDGQIDFKPISEEDLTLAGAVSFGKEAIAVAKAAKNGFGEKVEKKNAWEKEVLMDKIGDIAEYVLPNGAKDAYLECADRGLFETRQLIGSEYAECPIYETAYEI